MRMADNLLIFLCFSLSARRLIFQGVAVIPGLKLSNLCDNSF